MKKGFYLLIALALVNSLNATQLKKIQEDSTEFKSSKEKTLQKIEQKQKHTKLKLKKYSKIKYDKGLVGFSLFKRDKEDFKTYLKEKSISKYTLKYIFGTVDTPTAILISAFGYDWLYKRPDLAENFYILTEDIKDMNLYDKIRVADYYLRTGRPEKIPEIIEKSDCMSSFKYNSKCNYYLGIADYIVNGNNRNVFLRIAKNHIKKAKEIYYQKEFKK